MSQHSRRLRALLFLGACPLWTAYAQSTKAELFGIVRDPGSLAVDSAIVDLLNTATDARLSMPSDVNGSYHFFALPAGTYRVSVAKEGFATLRRDGIVLRVGDQINLELELRVGDVSQSVEVTAAAPLLQSTRGTTSLVVEQKKVVSLPLDGRNFVPLIALSPGVNLPPGNLLPRINGSRPRVSEYIYDGISVLQPEPGQVAFYPIVDAIEEFRVETNSPSAEYGRSNGGVIMVNQKSGSNTLHGTLFEFFRNEALNARNLFATTGAKPPFRRNQYGFVLGGPIQKNKTFFFVDWQGTRLDTGVVRTSTVPTSAQKRGVFTQPVFDPKSTRQTASGYVRDPFPNNTIPASALDQAAQAVVDRYPAPNVFSRANEAAANNFRRVGSDTTAQDHSKSGEFNLPYVREQFPEEEILVITFARWEEGLVVAPGNPKGIRTAEALVRKGVRFVNREPGSGIRALLDSALKSAGVPSARVQGYDRIALGHLPAAYHVLAGEADACIATRSAAQTFGLDFVPLHSARYDLVMRKRTGDLPSVKAFLDVLQRSTLRRKLEVLAGYDTSQTGSQLTL